MLRSKMMWFACALDKASVIELQFLEAAKVAPKCWFRPVFLTSSYSLWFGRLWIAKRPERSLLNLYPPTNKVGCCGSANHHILSTINLLRKNCYSCESKWMEHSSKQNITNKYYFQYFSPTRNATFIFISYLFANVALNWNLGNFTAVVFDWTAVRS